MTTPRRSTGGDASSGTSKTVQPTARLPTEAAGATKAERRDTITRRAPPTPVEKEFKFSVELATTLNLDGTPDKGCYEQGQEKDAGNRLAGCDYAMHGKVFKYDNMSANKV